MNLTASIYVLVFVYEQIISALRHLWLGGSVVRALDTRPKGPWFNAQPMHCQVTALGKLFTPTCLCRSKCLVVGVDS